MYLFEKGRPGSFMDKDTPQFDICASHQDANQNVRCKLLPKEAQSKAYVGRRECTLAEERARHRGISQRPLFGWRGDREN